MTSEKKGFVNTANTRPGIYDAVIKDIAKKQVCPFCPEQLSNFHKNPILKEKDFWLATENMYPYKGAKKHILFIHKKHLSNISELSNEAWSELHTIIKDILSEKDIPGGTLMMRFGDTRYTGASVTHLHAHLISPNPDAPDYEPVIARVG